MQKEKKTLRRCKIIYIYIDKNIEHVQDKQQDTNKQEH